MILFPSTAQLDASYSPSGISDTLGMNYDSRRGENKQSERMTLKAAGYCLPSLNTSKWVSCLDMMNCHFIFNYAQIIL